MNELQVKTIELNPAKVVFNHEEIEKDLEKNLQKYSGLTFTEDDAVECRSTIAELRKGKKAVDEYRKKTKKELTAPVTEFENKCKELNKKFDDVINPLVEQNEEFEKKRRDEKREKVHELLAQIIEEFDLEEKYAAQLAIEDSFLTKSKTMKTIEEELSTSAEHLKMQQDKAESDKQVISSSVKLANSEHDVTLSESAYISLLEFKDVKAIQAQISADTNQIIEERLREQEKVGREAASEQTPPEPKKEDPEPIGDVPFADDLMPDPFVAPTKIKRAYAVHGTDEQLEMLEGLMNYHGIDWVVVTNE